MSTDDDKYREAARRSMQAGLVIVTATADCRAGGITVAELLRIIDSELADSIAPSDLISSVADIANMLLAVASAATKSTPNDVLQLIGTQLLEGPDGGR